MRNQAISRMGVGRTHPPPIGVSRDGLPLTLTTPPRRPVCSQHLDSCNFDFSKGRRHMRNTVGVMIAVAITSVGFVRGEEPGSTPRPVPLTRPDMKQLMEDMKARKPRIPLPELTDEEKAKLGERGGGYEGRLR